MRAAKVIASSPATNVTIPVDERTPLLSSNNNNNNNKNNNSNNGSKLRWYGSGSNNNNGPGSSAISCNNKECSDTHTATNGGMFSAEQHGFCDFRLIAFVLMLAIGLTIAFYLLILETRMPTLKFSLDLVNYEIWSRNVNVNVARPPDDGKVSGNGNGETLKLNHTNVVNVLVTHTGGKSCAATMNCISALHRLQTQSTHHNKSGGSIGTMSYNFLIGNNEVYEVRGWENASDYEELLPRNATLLVGFIGNYTHNTPSYEQLRSLLSLLKESVRRHKLHGHYQVFAMRNLTNSPIDAEALLYALKGWPQFNRLLLHTS